MDKAHLEKDYRIQPGIVSVTLFESPEYDPEKPYRVSAEQHPIDPYHERLFRNISADHYRCVWMLSLPTVRADWIKGFSPMSLTVLPSWIVKESGGREWYVVVGGATKRDLISLHLVCIEGIGDLKIRRRT